MSKDIGSGYKQLDATPGNSLGFNLDVDTIKQQYIPLPPLAEQKRIVEKIENAFAKLDQISEQLA